MTQLDEYVDIFDLLGDWDQRYEYLIEMGENLPLLDDRCKVDDNLVKGCMSQVWITAELRDQAVVFRGDSDTAVIKGILALLISLCEGLTTQQILNIDMDDVFRSLKLDKHLSPNRHLGVYAMFELMKHKAAELEPNPQAA
ncbi:MAG: SufE family protein [Gammaproteobacteria bacterium]|nr:SufE family protein [Gammaproteobacteria bacterium]